MVQTVLAFRAILQEGAAVDGGLLALVLGSQVVYAALTGALAVWLAGRESTPLPSFLRRRKAPTSPAAR